MPRKRGASTKNRHSQTLPSLGEFGLIEHLSALLGKNSKKNIVASIGDDAAVIRNGKDSVLVFTTDALLENIHFDLHFDDLFSVGWKSIVASLSDIAAMNADPLCAVVTIALPKKTSFDSISSLYKGIAAAATKYKCPIVGGDTTSSYSGLFISVAMLGLAARKAVTLRSGAKPGDIVCVTNDLGRAYAALRVLQLEKKNRKTLSPALLQKHKRPVPQFGILNRLRRMQITPSAMIDISDGLSSELNHIATQSKASIEINTKAIPVHSATKQCAKNSKEDALTWALQSGEEYELLFTCAPRYAKVLSAIRGVTIIGEIKRGRGVWAVTRQGKRTKLSSTGYVHF